MPTTESRPSTTDNPDDRTDWTDRTDRSVSALRDELHVLRERALRGPSERATEAQHAKGKLTARERIELLLDPGSFNEVEQLRRHR
ncbi:carboxyl transferase domain-containing protein, partial [Streptomyces tanashiensis]|uniref:carboxyl transferase domain-containing protein n=1 Tax=Streptomyces tanashiensis TaxID=67367 RepID=UPI0033D7BAF7